MLCKRCALNGTRRDGGDFGVCRIHAKSRCRFYGCETKTLGEELCAAHSHQTELARWKARANLQVIDPAAEFDLSEIRSAKLLQAKFHAHEAVEIFFRAINLAVEAMWGNRPATADPAVEVKRKAA